MIGPVDPARWRRVLRWTVTGFSTLLSIGWLVLLALFLAGFVVGPAPPDEPPAIDTGESPSNVAADALAQLEVRDHTFECWLYRRNVTTGNVSGGILYRTTVEHSAGEVRTRIYLAALEKGKWITPSAPTYSVFSTRWVQYQGTGDEGPRVRVHGKGRLYDGDTTALARHAPRVRRANVTVAAENSTHLVISITEDRVVDRFAGYSRSRNVSNDVVRLVVRKGSEPHLDRVVYRGETDAVSYRERYLVRNVGTADARLPADAPGMEVTAAIGRTGRGVERIVEWMT